ncbi:hypothetical protein JYU34_003680 [Plutella xylostella]|uniref:Uncharacterized protein n=1 Tax=Plutella xylostella TaxID=51655 RepID=A0ABQ7R0M6_PLUXY|nr:hypothetical protein JYU34_003680 [Plutella xylostella]
MTSPLSFRSFSYCAKLRTRVAHSASPLSGNAIRAFYSALSASLGRPSPLRPGDFDQLRRQHSSPLKACCIGGLARLSFAEQN